MKQTIITAIGIILVVALPVALGGYWLEALALFIVCAGALSSFGLPSCSDILDQKPLASR